MITDSVMTCDDPVVPGRGSEVLTVLEAAAAALDEVPGVIHQFGGGDEDRLVSVLLRLHGRSAQVTAVATADAVDRGAVADSDSATTSQWLTAHRAHGVPVEPKTVRAMAFVADACRARKNSVIAAALRDGSCSVESAKTALAQADKVAPVIPAAGRDEVLGWFLQVDPGHRVFGRRSRRPRGRRRGSTGTICPAPGRPGELRRACREPVAAR